MNPSPVPASDASMMTRRDAIRRTATMLGIAVSPSLLTGLLEAQTASRSDATPRYLTAAQFATVAAIAERILPRTDTPGAGDVGVPAFLDLMYGKYMTEIEQAVFAAGIAEVDGASRDKGRRFSELSTAAQDALLKTIADAAQGREKTFFHSIKELTLLGYFTSEPIGRNVLHYDPIPGRYDGCIPLAEAGNVSWTR